MLRRILLNNYLLEFSIVIVERVVAEEEWDK